MELRAVWSYQVVFITLCYCHGGAVVLILLLVCTATRTYTRISAQQLCWTQRPILGFLERQAWYSFLTFRYFYLTTHPGWRSQYGYQAKSWMILGSIAGNSNRLSYSLEAHPASYEMGTGRVSTGKIDRGMRLTTQLHLVPTWRISGAIPLLPLVCLHGADRDRSTLFQTSTFM
jgi:hypothetical protein